jgi:hypothetical protein
LKKEENKMNCTEAEKYIFADSLPDYIEIADTELAEHLIRCPLCKAKYEASRKYFNFVSHIQKSIPVPDDPNSLACAIIEQIGNLPSHSSVKSRRRIWQIIYYPVFRYAALILLVIVGSLYFYEEYYSFQMIYRLEQKYGTQAARRIEEKQNSASVTALYDLPGLDGKHFRLPGNWMLIKESEIVRLLKEYSLYSTNNLPAADIGNDLKKYFSERDIKELLDKRSEFNNILNRSFPGSENNHEK